ncbi:hypothetical protein Bca4012_070998 [Brassica carinata]
MAMEEETRRNQRRSFILGNGVYDSCIDMSIFWDRLQGLNLNDQRPRSIDPGAWPNFSTELEELMKLKSRFTEFSIVFVTRSENVSYDSLVKIARSFHRKLYYIGCFFRYGSPDHFKVE